ncbi:YHS domain-containing protein [Pseudonocardia thermophila]|nr:YHS domain-containing protein [Pseudonocardia thermophila]
MTVEVSVAGRPMTVEQEHDLADRLLRALTEAEQTPESTIESARELIHVLVGRPRAWATGGPAGPRYLVRVTVPGAWATAEFARTVVPLITDAIAGTEPDPTRLRREPHCVAQLIGLREHHVGTLGRATTSALTRLMTGGYRGVDDERTAPTGGAIDPVCGMVVDRATATITLIHDGVQHAFCSASCRKVVLEDVSMDPGAGSGGASGAAQQG